jgi:nicotinate-nucleotide adenylyltransferase
MLQAALQNAGPGFTIDTRELERLGPSYMVDTLASLRADIGPAPMGLILGTDAFLGLTGWHRWESLFDLAHIVVMQRPGYRPEWPPALAKQIQVRTSTTSRLEERPAGLIHFVDVTQLDISATRIRQTIARGLSARYLTSDPVLELIHQLDLYRSD